jgi:hypothetical protein
MPLVTDFDSPATRRQLLEWSILAIATCIGLALLPDFYARATASNLLGVIAATYVGFALASRGRMRVWPQIFGFLGFEAMALLGLYFNWWFIATGLVLHGFWDLLHHGERGQRALPIWYPPACATYDWVLAVFVVIRYGM